MGISVALLEPSPMRVVVALLDPIDFRGLIHVRSVELRDAVCGAVALAVRSRSPDGSVQCAMRALSRRGRAAARHVVAVVVYRAGIHAIHRADTGAVGVLRGMRSTAYRRGKCGGA